MFIRFKESGLYKSLSKIFGEKFREVRDVEEDNRVKKEIISQPSYPDAIWHRSKSARFRQN